MINKKWAVLLILVMAVAALALSVSGCKKEPVPPPPECEDDMDCPGGKACEGGKCIVKVVAPAPECTVDADCSGGKICRSEKCVYECTVDSDCSTGYVCNNYRCAEPACNVQTVNFDFDEYYLTAEAQATLRANAECMKKKQVATVTIEGHCDERGTAEYNLSLGQKRAQSVRDFLVDLGMDPAKIRVISYGEERPVDSASNEDAWAKNRRAVTDLD